MLISTVYIVTYAIVYSINPTLQYLILIERIPCGPSGEREALARDASAELDKIQIRSSSSDSADPLPTPK